MNDNIEQSGSINNSEHTEQSDGISAGANIQYLLEQTKDMPEVYNRIATWLWIEFGIKSAELSLLLTYYEKKHASILSKERILPTERF